MMFEAFDPRSDGQVGEELRRLPVLAQLREALSGKHLLVTGGTGFFGRWLLALVNQLNRGGADIEVTLVSRDPETFLSAMPGYRGCAWLHWQVTDIRRLSTLPGRPAQLIVHAAADTSAAAHARPLELFETITEGARRVFDLAVHSGCERVLITGSGAQYGDLPCDSGVPEQHAGACASNQASSAYGEGKRAQETLAALYAQAHGLPVVMTRCFAFAGPGLPLDAHFAIGNFVRDALFSDEIVLQSSGEAVRSYLHGADLAAWLLLLLVRGEPGQAYNVGSDQPVTIAELAARVIARIAPHKPLRIMGRPVEGAARSFYVPDTRRARELGLQAWTSLDGCIDSMARWAGQLPRPT
ncbi:NAD-dependent epimerase/dehydratase family protein [Pseudomonas urmiensis]|jgi:nucleoside-diphosphate-sugar epimerase|uniref:NAD-dependent epimerase/dehydratase family protein n=1 Tax=Pseudomonas urmiensis TaxID=2745493 RepID=UPI003D13B2D3